jgi:hypothetical protein
VTGSVRRGPAAGDGPRAGTKPRNAAALRGPRVGLDYFPAPITAMTAPSVTVTLNEPLAMT